MVHAADERSKAFQHVLTGVWRVRPCEALQLTWAALLGSHCSLRGRSWAVPGAVLLLLAAGQQSESVGQTLHHNFWICACLRESLGRIAVAGISRSNNLQKRARQLTWTTFFDPTVVINISQPLGHPGFLTF